MGINFANNATLTQVGSYISAPGRIVQTVQTNYTGQMSTSSTSPVDFFTSSSITLTNANNLVLIEWHSDNRVSDWGDGTWNLYYMLLIYVNTGAQLSYTGYRGELTNSIRHYHKSTTHSPGSVGPHTYKLQGWSYQALNTNFGGGAAGGDATSYIRLSEIAV
jgi:hypothetical protein